MYAIEILKKYYDDKTETFNILLTHSKAVLNKALQLIENNKHLNINAEFVKDATLLHDIGIFKTNAPKIGCYGKLPYICHGYLGRELLDLEGLPEHALICERHVGVGISLEDILRGNLPLPHRDMTPQSIEEKLICYADKFFTKRKDSLEIEIPLERVRENILSYGKDKLDTFDELHRLFNSRE